MSTKDLIQFEILNEFKGHPSQSLAEDFAFMIEDLKFAGLTVSGLVSDSPLLLRIAFKNSCLVFNCLEADPNGAAKNTQPLMIAELKRDLISKPVYDRFRGYVVDQIIYGKSAADLDRVRRQAHNEAAEELFSGLRQAGFNCTNDDAMRGVLRDFINLWLEADDRVKIARIRAARSNPASLNPAKPAGAEPGGSG